VTVYFSDHFAGDTNTTLDAGRRAPASKAHGRIRVRRAEVTQDLGDNDVVRMMPVRSSDRVLALFLTCTASGAAGAIDVGLYRAGNAHDGTVIQKNIFANGQVTTTALNRVDIFGGHLLSGTKRGWELWRASFAYSADPREDWNLTVDCNAATTDATTIVLEYIYTAGD